MNGVSVWECVADPGIVELHSENWSPVFDVCEGRLSHPLPVFALARAPAQQH